METKANCDECQCEKGRNKQEKPDNAHICDCLVPKEEDGEGATKL